MGGPAAGESGQPAVVSLPLSNPGVSSWSPAGVSRPMHGRSTDRFTAWAITLGLVHGLSTGSLLPWECQTGGYLVVRLYYAVGCYGSTQSSPLQSHHASGGQRTRPSTPEQTPPVPAGGRCGLQSNRHAPTVTGECLFFKGLATGSASHRQHKPGVLLPPALPQEAPESHGCVTVLVSSLLAGP
jgi:hypothetical protein